MAELAYADQGYETEPANEDAGDTDRKDPVQILHNLIQRTKVTNLAADMDENKLEEIGTLVCKEAEIDEDSRGKWKRRTEAGMKLALQESEPKTFPWPNAANIRAPLMTVAGIQFAARAYPAIVNGNQVVKAQIVGDDPGGMKRARGDRVAAHMSWQCLTEMEEWEPQVDTMLHNLPIVGCAFKKTYWDPALGRNRSDFVSAMDLIVNMAAPSMDVAPRITQCIRLYPHQIESRVKAGVFIDVDYGQPPDGSEDDDAPREFYEQHRRLDLDDDGYAEPYTVTVAKETEKVCRIRACYDENGIVVNQATGDIILIEPLKYFTKVPFIPNPDGGFYDVGFAWLLSPLNNAVNTIINQLLDAGTLANTGGGFIGSQLRLKGGTMRFQPGEYKEVDVPGGVARDNIVTLTFPGPSEVLFKLLGTIVEMAQEVANVKDVLTGEQPSANTPATTTLALIEQGLKVFTAIYKRIHRAMKEEFGKLYKLNQTYFDPQRYAAFADAPSIAQQDYSADPMDIIPVSDPAMVSDMQRLARAEFLQRYIGMPGVNSMAIVRRQWEAAGIQNIDELMQPPPSGPPPEVLAKFAELEAKVNSMNAASELSKAQAIKVMAEAAQLEPAQQLEALRLYIDSFVAHNDAAQGAVQPGGEGQAPKQMPVKPPLLPIPGTPTAGPMTPMAANAGVPSPS